MNMHGEGHCTYPCIILVLKDDTSQSTQNYIGLLQKIIRIKVRNVMVSEVPTTKFLSNIDFKA